MNHVQSSLIAAAIGATVGVIGAASIFIYQQVMKQQQHQMSNNNLEAVNKRISELATELETLRAQQAQQKNRKKRNAIRRHIANDSTHTITDNDTDVDAFSATDTDVGTDMADDEFYDCSDSEGGAGDNDNRTTGAVNNLDSVLADIDERITTEAEFEERVYCQLQNLSDCHPENVEVIWRFARACYHYTNCISDPNMKKVIISEGMGACENLLRKSPRQNADFHIWYAILVGLLTNMLSVKERILNGYLYRDHIVIGLEMRPNDSTVHHLLGRFNYAVASLTWIERKVAATLFSSPPYSTFEEALDCFKRAEELAVKPYLENRLYLGKVYIDLKQYDKALYWLKKTIEEPSSTTEDKQTQSEASSLLAKYAGYV